MLGVQTGYAMSDLDGYSLSIKSQPTLSNAWPWEIYRAGRRVPVAVLPKTDNDGGQRSW